MTKRSTSPLSLAAVAALALAAVPARGADPRAADPAAEEAAPAPFTEADVAPLFSAGPLRGARAAFEAGRWEEAAGGFARGRGPEARYVRGVALVWARRGPEASEALAGLERALPDLADRVTFWRGRARDLAGDPRGAAEAYAGVPEGSVLWGEAQIARARALEAGGERAAALSSLSPVLGLPVPDETVRLDAGAEALLLAGRLHAAGGAADDLDRARRALLDCWAGHPLAPAAAACLAEVRKLPGERGEPPPPEEAVRHAEGLLDANRNEPALAELTRLVAGLPAPGPSEPLACRARFAMGKAYRKLRQHAKAIETLRPVVEGCAEPALRVRAVYVLASASSIVEPEQGIARYRELARDYPAHALADDALFYAADLLARAGRTEEALAVLADLSEKYPRGDFRAEALFRTAWIQKAAGYLPGSLAALSRLERDYESSDAYEYARAVYWRARILAERGEEGDAARAEEAWGALSERFPADYYGLLARARLEERRPGSAPPWPRPDLRPEPRGFRYALGRLARDRHFRAGVLLLRMGLERAALDELAAVDRKLLAEGDALLAVAELLDRAGDHKSSSRLVRTVGRPALRQRPEGAALRVWKVAYPVAFRSDVERWSGPAGVPPELLLALMREESGLDPGAISGAGAVGLTQLMLPTAQSVAKKLRMGRVQQADLMKPPVAIRIGATYLGGLLRRYAGSEALALAAYNVGDVPVRNWLRARGSLPLDAFVEEIPVQETRGYVKRVLRSYAAYRLLYGAAAGKPLLLGQALPPSS